MLQNVMDICPTYTIVHYVFQRGANILFFDFF